MTRLDEVWSRIEPAANRKELSSCFDSGKSVQRGMSVRRTKSQRRRFALVVIALMCSSIHFKAYASELLRSNDVICFLGGANVVSEQEYGYLETIVRMKFPALNLRFRSLAHE